METINTQLLDDMAELAIFVQVVEQNGFSAAGRRLGLSKSAVSKKISLLEKRLGLRLLQRSTRAMSMTEAGQQLYQRASEAVRLISEARQIAGGMADSPRGNLRVTASVTFGKLCLAPLLPEFLSRYPEITLQISLLDRMVDLVEEGFDLALRLTEKPPEYAVAKALMPIRYRLCAAPSYLRNRSIEHPADLENCNCLYYGHHNLANVWTFKKDQQQSSVAVSSTVIVNNSEVVRDLLLAGQGVGLVWNYAVDEAIAHGQLIPLLEDWRAVGPFGQTAYALWLAQTHLPAKTRAFIDFLVEKFRSADLEQKI